MRKPNEVVYGPLDRPPASVVVLTGLQHVALVSVFLIYPVLVAQAAGATPAVGAAMVSLTLIALAIGTLLQVVTFGPVGSGYLCPPTPTIIFVIPALTAAGRGGLALVFGMTAIAGLAQAALARVLPRLRQYLPPEVAGLVSLLIGIATGVLGLRAILGTGPGGAATGSSGPTGADLTVALATLGVMIALNVWGRGAARLFCVLIGLAAGAALAWSLGVVASDALLQVADGPVFAVPSVAHVAFDFELAYLGAYLVAALVGAIKVIGNVATLQRANDASWVRTDMDSVGRGVLADGLGNVVAAGLGSPGLNASTVSVGLATATGVHARVVAWAMAAILCTLAFFPRLGLLLYALPGPVLGAALVFSSAFIVVNGVEILGTRMLDARRTLVIGLAIVFGLAVDLFPETVAALPKGLQPMLGTPLMLGAIVALALNLLFRIGVRRTETMTVAKGTLDTAAIRGFVEACGAGWGARRDVIERASFSLAQAVEAVAGSGAAADPIELSLSFDEFRLDARLSYDGEPLEMPEQRPSVDEILSGDDGERRLAGYMLRRCADRVSVTGKGGRATVWLHFDH
jgi:NCS2 family nucleobase:cation symporter-2